jgi:hypothetical protein
MRNRESEAGCWCVGFGPLEDANPDIFIDITNGNVFGPGPENEFLGCVLHYLPEEGEY